MSGDPRYQLDFALSRLIRYNGKRQRFFDGLHRMTAFVNAAAGTSAFVTVLSNRPLLAAVFTAAVALGSAADTAIAFAERARKYGEQRSRYFGLYETLLETPPEKFSKDRFRAKRLRIDSAGPPPMRVLDVMCRNEEQIARGWLVDDTVYIAPLRRLLSQWIDLPPPEWQYVWQKRGRAQPMKEPEDVETKPAPGEAGGQAPSANA